MAFILCKIILFVFVCLHRISVWCDMNALNESMLNNLNVVLRVVGVNATFTRRKHD